MNSENVHQDILFRLVAIRQVFADHIASHVRTFDKVHHLQIDLLVFGCREKFTPRLTKVLMKQTTQVVGRGKRTANTGDE